MLDSVDLYTKAVCGSWTHVKTSCTSVCLSRAFMASSKVAKASCESHSKKITCSKAGANKQNVSPSSQQNDKNSVSETWITSAEKSPLQHQKMPAWRQRIRLTLVSGSWGLSVFPLFFFVPTTWFIAVSWLSQRVSLLISFSHRHNAEASNPPPNPNVWPCRQTPVERGLHLRTGMIKVSCLIQQIHLRSRIARRPTHKKSAPFLDRKSIAEYFRLAFVVVLCKWAISGAPEKCMPQEQCQSSHTCGVVQKITTGH